MPLCGGPEAGDSWDAGAGVTHWDFGEILQDLPWLLWSWMELVGATRVESPLLEEQEPGVRKSRTGHRTGAGAGAGSKQIKQQGTDYGAWEGP